MGTGIFELLIFGGIGWWLWDTLRDSTTIGEFSLESGATYAYQIGNQLSRYGASFKGAQTTLPMFLPHIYIDAHNGDHGRGMRFYAESGQTVQLEGDFNKYFQVYLPKGQQDLVLSILSPDVMQTLIDISDRYDVEIVGQTLRLISHKRPYKHADREADLLQALTAITGEIDHRLQSWTAEDSRQAMETDLQTEDNPAVKFGRFPVRLSTVVISVTWGPVGIILWWITVYNLSHDPHLDQGSAIEGLVGCFLFFPILFGLLIAGVPRGWFNWIFKYLDR